MNELLTNVMTLVIALLGISFMIGGRPRRRVRGYRCRRNIFLISQPNMTLKFIKWLVIMMILYYIKISL